MLCQGGRVCPQGKCFFILFVLMQSIKLFFAVSCSKFLSFFLLLYVSKDTVLCRGVLITVL